MGEEWSLFLICSLGMRYAPLGEEPLSPLNPPHGPASPPPGEGRFFTAELMSPFPLEGLVRFGIITKDTREQWSNNRAYRSGPSTTREHLQRHPIFRYAHVHVHGETAHDAVVTRAVAWEQARNKFARTLNFVWQVKLKNEFEATRRHWSRQSTRRATGKTMPWKNETETKPCCRAC